MKLRIERLDEADIQHVPSGTMFPGYQGAYYFFELNAGGEDNDTIEELVAHAAEQLGYPEWVDDKSHPVWSLAQRYLKAHTDGLE